MFKPNTYVTVIGALRVKAINDEYVELDPFDKGQVERTEKYVENGFTEISEDGTDKAFDGFSIGDFFKLNGKYKVIRSNEIFTKIELEGHMLSIPNHKLLEVE